MEFISTKNMKNEDAPQGTVLVKYLEPSWGGWFCQYGMAYFDNPNDYENPEDGEGWILDDTNIKINVVGYYVLPKINQEVDNPYRGLTQKQTKEKYGDYINNLGNVGV